MKINIPDFNQGNILIVGDVMLDRYWQGTTERISPEAPVPITHIQQAEDKPGGAGNVALNIAALGGQASLLAYSGTDPEADRLEDLLNSQQVVPYFVRDKNHPTITKIRVVSHNQQLIRLDFETPYQSDNKILLEKYKQLLPKANVVVLSDYAKGVLSDPQPFIQLARKHNIPILIDPKTDNVSLYNDATLLTPNLSEFQAMVGKCDSEEDIVNKGLKLIKQHNWQALLVTRSKDGMTLLRPGKEPLHLPTHAREVYDVTGAGDTVIATLAASLAAKQPLEQAVAISNLAAGIVVTKLGAAVVTPAELRRQLQRDSQADHMIFDEKQLLTVIKDTQAHGETVVMTNGCFDLIHAGHIAYLEEAKTLGDRLLVAVNDDDSVKRLKGDSRPLTPLNERMAVLAGLSSVDWIVPFSEDTPERLICALLPDILVKGGDYQVENIAGAKCVLDNNGRVEILKFVNGCSTSKIVEKIKKGS